MPPTGDAQQEERMRRRLVEQGYDQPYGTMDAAIRRNLGITGKCADFVGYHPHRGTWLIAESKGGNIDSAHDQLANTLRALLVREPGAAGKIELMLYMSASQYKKLIRGELSGYIVRDTFLGHEDEALLFHFIALEDARIRIVQEGSL